ncbi:hypothetical protein Tco_0158512 [Tanacetum coccineum]
MTTLAEFMIIVRADNRLPMLEKSLYDSWKSHMEHYMENRENRRMILSSVQNGPLIWPIVTKEDGTTRTKTYAKLFATEKIQADCDYKDVNIILQGLPPDVYAIVNHHKVAKDIWDIVKLMMQGMKFSLQEKECKLYDEFNKFTFMKCETLYQYYWRFAQLINNMNVINMSMRSVQVNTKFLNSLPPEWSKFVTDITYHSPQASTQPMTEFPHMDSALVVFVFNPIDDLIACLNKAMAFLIAVAFTRGGKGKVILVLVIRVMLLLLGEIIQADRKGLLNAITAKVKDTWRGNALSLREQGTLHDPGIPDGQAVQTTISNNAAFQTEDIDAYDSDCDDVSNAKVVLVANISNYGSDVISDVPYSDSYHNDMDNQKKESLLQTFTVFKNESKEKESKSMENEIDLEKKIKELDNIVYRVGQSAQTVHMLTKPKVFYDNAHKQALVESPSELPKVSLVNESLKKLKFHLAKFDNVVKKRTTPDALIEGEWGFAHLKTIFMNAIVPFLKSLKDIFSVFDKDLLNEITEVQIIFHQIEAAVQQCSVDKQCFEIA